MKHGEPSLSAVINATDHHTRFLIYTAYVFNTEMFYVVSVLVVVLK